MPKQLTVKEVIAAGGKVDLGAPRCTNKEHLELIQRFALRILSVLADAPSQEVRFRALEKARRMVATK